MKFVVEGSLRMGRESAKFSREVEAETEAMARERIYSLLGSEHRAGRSDIDIEDVKRA